MYVIPWLHLYDRYLSKFHKRWNTDSIASYTERKQYKCRSGDHAEEPQLKAKQLSMVALSFVLLSVIYHTAVPTQDCPTAFGIIFTISRLSADCKECIFGECGKLFVIYKLE